MNVQKKTKEFYKNLCLAYPGLKPQDLLKALHQSIFGCGHFVGEQAYAYLSEELNALTNISKVDIEPLDGDFSRVYLQYLKKHGLNPETLFTLFVMSSEMSQPDIALVEEKLSIIIQLSSEGLLPFSYNEMQTAINNWRHMNFPLQRHSPEYRYAYAPAYRVIHNSFVKWLSSLSAIDKACTSSDSVLVAIEGGSASGKTTFSHILSTIYDCNIFHMDDFFLQPHQRTKERFATPGGNIDKERFLEEVLLPLSEDKAVKYRRFDCSTQTILPEKIIEPKKLNIIEGAYSTHPALSKYYDLKIFLRIDKNTQKKRIESRNPDMKERFLSEWIPLEEKYFDAYNIPDTCHIIVEVY